MPDGDVEINADRAKSEALARAQQIAQQLASQKSSNNTPPTSSFSSSGGVGYSQNNSNNHFSATATYGQPDSHLHGLTNGDENSENFIVKDLNVPGKLCGLIIGKNGDTIKKLQADTGVKIELIQDSSTDTSGHKPLRFRGYMEKVSKAIEHVKNYLVTHGDIKLMSSLLSQEENLSTKHIKVPQIAVGAIIGKNGETIREIAQLSNAKVQFDKDELESPNPDKTVIIVGANDAVQAAEAKIIELINMSVQLSQPSGVPTVGREIQTTFPIPFEKIGSIIGKSGSTIREINSLSGAFAKISEEPPDENGMKNFVIQGGTENVKMCIHFLCERAGVTSPFEQMMAMNGGMNPMMQIGVASSVSNFLPQIQQQPQVDAPVNANSSQQNQSAPASYPPQQFPQNTSNYQPAPLNVPESVQNSIYGTYALPNTQQAQTSAYQQQPAVADLQNTSASNNTAIVSQEQINSAATPATNAQQKDYTLEWIAYFKSVGQFDQAAQLQKTYDEQQKTNMGTMA